MGSRMLCYIIVVDDDTKDDDEKDDRVVAAPCNHSQSKTTFWYTQLNLQKLLQLVGCKVHHAFKISRRVFEILEDENLKSESNFRPKLLLDLNANPFPSHMRHKDYEDAETSRFQLSEEDLAILTIESKDKLYKLYKKQATMMIKRKRFLDVICSCLGEYSYVGPSQRDDLILACRLRERKESVTILLCGTSGCGKSTLSSLLASRLGITTVVSTDSIRHMMRGFTDEKDNPLLWASTYHAGEFLDPVAVAEAKRKRKDQKLSSSPWNGKADSEESTRTQHGLHDTIDCSFSEKGPPVTRHTRVNSFDKQVGSKVLAIEGYKAQSEMVIDSLDRLISIWEDRKDSVVVEGVHLSLNFVMGLMKKHPSIIPFLIYISNEEKHLERFAVRAKYMTLDPSKNKYVKYIKNIRTIQDYLCKRAEKHLVPMVDNTNVDRSVASIHSTIFSCMRRRQMEVSLYDVASNTVKVINDEYFKHCDANSFSSKGMLQLIQRQGSLRHYIAIVNSDGSVAKAWPFSGVDKTRELSTSGASTDVIGSPIYGPVQVREAKSANVHVQFGNFGVGSWPNGTEGTSHTGGINGSRVDGDGEPTQFSSSSISPSHQEGHAKELTEEVSASESDEEPIQDNNDDDSTTDAEFMDELGGSVAESSGRSDEEYEADQKDDTFDVDAISIGALGNTNNVFDGCHKLRKASKSPSLRRSRSSFQEGKPYNHVHSLPFRRSRSNKLKNADTQKFSSDA